MHWPLRGSLHGRQVVSAKIGLDDAGNRSALRAVDVSQRFGGLVALDSVNLVVASGTIHGLIGPNGAGKSTLFNIISGIIRPTRGRVYLVDDDVTDWPAWRRARLGLARTFQQPVLFERLTLRESVMVAIGARDGHTGLRGNWCDLWWDEADKTLEEFGLSSYAGDVPSSLSHGHRRVSEFAIVLASKPKVLILDEVSAGMSGDDRRSVMDIVKACACERNIAVLVCEHNLEFVYGLANSITVLSDGKVLVEGSPSEISTNEEVARIYAGAN